MTAKKRVIHAMIEFPTCGASYYGFACGIKAFSWRNNFNGNWRFVTCKRCLAKRKK